MDRLLRQGQGEGANVPTSKTRQGGPRFGALPRQRSESSARAAVSPRAEPIRGPCRAASRRQPVQAAHSGRTSSCPFGRDRPHTPCGGTLAPLVAFGQFAVSIIKLGWLLLWRARPPPAPPAAPGRPVSAGPAG